MKLLLLFIFLIFLPIATAEKINGLEVEWESSTDYTLSWTNPSITKGDYAIKVIDFDWTGNAAISITKQGETKNGVLSQGETTIIDFTKNTTYFQGVRIYAKTISNYSLPINLGTYPCCPAAEISVEISKTIEVKKPKLELVLTPNWDGRLGYISTVNVEARNTGDAAFSWGNVTINISGLKPADEWELHNQALTYNPSKETLTRGWSLPLLANNSYSLNISLKSVLPNKTTYTISVQSYFKDFNGNVYPATASAQVSLNPTVELTKKITSSVILGEKTYREIDKFFGLGNVTIVNLIIKNTQSYPLKSVNLTDAVMGDFSLKEDTISPRKGFILSDNGTKLQWVFDLNVSENKEFRYEMIPKKTGTFTTTAAVVQWDEFGNKKTKSSDKPAIRVYGVFVAVTKKADKTSLKLNESVNVTVALENIGDYPVGINVTDTIPKNSTLISGSTSYSGFLYPKQSVSLAYALSAYSLGELEMPSPQVSFWKKEYEGSFGVITANTVTVIEPTPAPPATANISQNLTPAPTPTPLPKSLLEIIEERAPWLEGAIPIIMLFIAIILMLMLHTINK